MHKLLLVSACVTLSAGPGGADDANRTTDPPKPTWYDRVTFGGDLRLRYEGFNWPGHLHDGRRDRFRYRLRLGLEAQLLDSLDLGVQVRSGNPQNPISDNQSFDDSFEKNPISFAEAWVSWQPTGWLALRVGKFAPEKLWTVSDMQWDDDVVTEGALESFRWTPGGAVRGLDLNLYQFVLNEAGDSVDSYLLGGQVVPAFALGERNDLALGAGFEAISHPEAVAELYLTRKLVIDSEHVTNLYDPESGELVSDFRIGSLFVEWKNATIERWPIRVTLFFYRNFGAGERVGVLVPVGPDQDPMAAARGTDNDTAWFGRVQVGDYKRPGQVALRFARYDSKPDALFFAYAQSDTRRASNVDGYRTDVRIGMPKEGYINVTWYRTRWTVGEDSTMDRWQLDYAFKF